MKKLLMLSLSAALLLVPCGDPEEFPVKDMSSFNQIQSNGMVTVNLVSGTENKVLSTSMAEGSYGVSNNVLTMNGAGTITIAISNTRLLWCNARSIENKEPVVADTLNMCIHGRFSRSQRSANQRLPGAASC